MLFAKLPRILILVLLAGQIQWPALAADSLQSPVRIQVDAGRYVRTDSVCSVDIDADLNPAEWQLWEVTAEGDRPVPSQWDAVHSRRLLWILRGRTPAEGVRQFELRRGSPVVSSRLAAPELSVEASPAALVVRHGAAKVLQYNAAHVEPPAGIESRFGRSAYLHPVWTPGGKIVTDEFPPDHAHQSGLFLAYTKAVFEGRPTNFWELRDDRGRVLFKKVVGTVQGPVFGGFRVEQEHRDLTVPGGKAALNEVWDVRVWQPGTVADYWIFDVYSELTCASESPLILPEYHYGGFAVRGARGWTVDNSQFLTEDGLQRETGNHARTKWCDLTGDVAGKRAGVTLMTHGDNFRFPEPVRIHPTMPYFVYTASPLGDWAIEPQRPLRLAYRCIAHDGEVDVARWNQLWRDFSEPPLATIPR